MLMGVIIEGRKARMEISRRQRADYSEYSGPLSAAVIRPLAGLQLGNRTARC